MSKNTVKYRQPRNELRHQDKSKTPKMLILRGFCGVPGAARTRNRRSRSPEFYPIELRVHIHFLCIFGWIGLERRRKQTKRIFQPIKKPITKGKTPLLWAFLLYRQSFHYVYYFSAFIAISIAFTVKLPSKYRQKKSFKK